MNVSNSACVKSSNSVRRPKSKDTKSKNRLLKNTNDKSSFAHDRKMSSSDSIDSNKRETMNSTNLVGDDLLTGSRESNLYTISISKLAASSLVCLMSKATSTKSWLWHQRLSHLNFGTINQLTSKDLVDGLSKFKNHTLGKAVLTMFIFSKTLEFLWPKAIATAFFTQNLSIVHTRYNKTPYELIRGRKPNVQYFHVFGSLCYLTNDRDDLGKIKPKADIGSSLNCLYFQDSSHKMNEIPSHQELDNLFGPLYEEYYGPSTSEESNNSTANTLDVENTPSPSSIIGEDSDALQLVTSSEEPTTQESSTLVLETHSDKQVQEDVTELDRNTIMHSFDILEFREAELSSNYQDPSNMHEFH
ncbi:retrovirus-related pol polyprotein from transposon TNT 1-94 [Tanacetum coccineum]